MQQEFKSNGRPHDILAVVLGAMALGVLISSYWQVDLHDPNPFYKGPLIFPLMALGLAVLAALPAARRLVRAAPDATWHLDGYGRPVKPLVMLGFIVLYLAGLVLVGLEISTLAVMSGALYYLGNRSWFELIGVPVIMTVVAYVVFKQFLDVFFPTPLLFALFME